MKTIRKIGIIVLLLMLYAYVCYFTFLPSNYILFQGENLPLSTIWGISVEQVDTTNPNLTSFSSSYGAQTVSKVLNGLEAQNSGTVTLNLALFGKVPVKDVTVNVIPKTSVIPLGNSIGLKLYTSGVLVVGMSEIQGEDNKRYKPYEGIDIKEGDRIININGEAVTCTADLIEDVNASQGNDLHITYVRDEDTMQTTMKPVKTGEKEYKLGLWVRDAAAGVGTATFYEPSTKSFGALGHGILDIDTEELITIANGELVTTNILSIQKGEKGSPGEIRGSIENSKVIGEISKNTNFGIFGQIQNTNYLGVDTSKAMEVMEREKIEIGKATILCSLDGKAPKEYEIEIQKKYVNNNQNNKSMVIRVVDPELLEQTGGIIQGMSGSPILQNGKFVGAITHVLVNDPTTGYRCICRYDVKTNKRSKLKNTHMLQKTCEYFFYGKRK